MVVVTKQKRDVYSSLCVNEYRPHTHKNYEKVYDDGRNRHGICDIHDWEALREAV